jgi:hypothetical protein
MSKHTKAGRKRSFRFHADPAAGSLLRVLMAYKRRNAMPRITAASLGTISAYVSGLRDFIR